jgi:hypothetical protein
MMVPSSQTIPNSKENTMHNKWYVVLFTIGGIAAYKVCYTEEEVARAKIDLQKYKKPNYPHGIRVHKTNKELDLPPDKEIS